ncbi:hypothetical protein [Nitratidesulfovibrio liaohensis]|uniref:Helix-turn-helix domain-containing protein n=1 Tax=Nitratidesulfovibrio liaohensis TaxID=2604158 RepID=A0ABY9R3S3_9BACT|nr:hypothetical protein [Nitratidesulfovibrio liaohensis]WMW66411.1 hypothetical protein KPS_000981 [Nitratidesulfovibrio liaohensis]
MNVPPKEQYIAAFFRCERAIKGRLKILLAHHAFPGHTATATQLAEAVGYPNHSAVNLNYGLLARRVCEEMGLRAEDIGGQPTDWLATFTDLIPSEGQGHVALKLHDNVVKALEDLGWVGP